MSKNRYRKITLISICIIILIGYVALRFLAVKNKNEHCLITQMPARIFDLNTVNIEVSNDLILNDFKVIGLDNHKVIFNKGKSHKGIDNNYGQHGFIVYYKDTLLFEIGYFKYNNWRSYDILFKFTKTNNNIDPTLIINGNDPNKGNIYYKIFERDKNGVIKKIKYYDWNKKLYEEELTNDINK